MIDDFENDVLEGPIVIPNVGDENEMTIELPRNRNLIAPIDMELFDCIKKAVNEIKQKDGMPFSNETYEELRRLYDFTFGAALKNIHVRENLRKAAKQLMQFYDMYYHQYGGRGKGKSGKSSMKGKVNKKERL